MAKASLTRKTKSKSFAEIFKKVLVQKADNEVLEKLRESIGAASENMSNDEVIATAIVQKAMRGDLSAAKFICEIGKELSDEPKEQRFKLELVVKGE